MKHDIDRRVLLTGLGITGLGVAGFGALARAAQGSTVLLKPPRRRLRDIYDKIARTDKGLGEARTPVQSLMGSATAQYVISASGVYYLTEHITGVAGQAAIEIQADHVELECDGFMFLGVP